MSAAYEALSSCYDLLSEADYAAETEYLLALLEKNGAGKRGVDLGCGSGLFTVALKKAGYEVVGVDISPEMLMKARERLGEAALLIEQDMAKLDLGEKFDFLLSVTDGFNYIPKRSAAGALKRFAAHLMPGGLLFLDLSSPYKLREKIGNNLFGEDYEDLSYLWFNTLKKDRVEMDLSFFFRQKNGLFEKKEEFHTQYIYEAEELTGMLKEAGFSVKKVTDMYGKPYKNTSERLNITAVKD